MRNLLVGLIGLLVCGTAWSQAAPSTAETEKAVAALEHQWLLSEQNNTPDTVVPLLADKFVFTTDSGRYDKTQFLAMVRKIKFSSMENTDVKVTVFGDTAIATGDASEKYTDASGKAVAEHTHWTDTWVKMPGGKWQCVASQDAPAAK